MILSLYILFLLLHIQQETKGRLKSTGVNLSTSFSQVVVCVQSYFVFSVALTDIDLTLWNSSFL